MLDGKAEPFARGAGLNAAALLVARSVITREIVISLLTRCAALALDPDTEADSTFAGQIISTALDLRAWELRDTVTTLFERELVDPFFCGDLEAVLDDLEPGATFDPNSHSFPPPLTDAWEAVRSWHFFDSLHPGRRQPWSPPAPPGKVSAPPPALGSWKPSQPYHAPAKTGRNDPCPCGSGKKYKKCCGA